MIPANITQIIVTVIGYLVIVPLALGSCIWSLEWIHDLLWKRFFPFKKEYAAFRMNRYKIERWSEDDTYARNEVIRAAEILCRDLPPAPDVLNGQEENSRYNEVRLQWAVRRLKGE
jgi:hypothetical protein